MPIMEKGQKPTVAIITSKYYEKLAVDSMMSDKTTFVKYKTEGESNVYTIGYIGSHKVVSTKLPMIGRQMAAQISSGNTTTRLLGSFASPVQKPVTRFKVTHVVTVFWQVLSGMWSMFCWWVSREGFLITPTTTNTYDLATSSFLHPTTKTTSTYSAIRLIFHSVCS